MAELSQQDVNRLLSALESMVKDSGRSTFSGRRSVARPIRDTSDDDKADNDLMKATKKLADARTDSYESLEKVTDGEDDLAKVMVDLIKARGDLQEATQRGEQTQEDTRKAFKSISDKLSDSLKRSSVSHDKYRASVEELADLNTGEQFIALQSVTKKLTSYGKAMDGTIRASNMLRASMLASHTGIKQGTAQYETYVNGLKQAISPLNNNKGVTANVLKNLGMLDSAAKELRDDLAPEDFVELHNRMSRAQEVMAKGSTSIGVEGVKLGENNSIAAAMADVQGRTGDVLGNERDKFMGALFNTAVELQHLGFEVVKDGLKLDEHGKLTEHSIEALTNAAKNGELDKALAELAKTAATTKKELDFQAIKGSAGLLGTAFRIADDGLLKTTKNFLVTSAAAMGLGDALRHAGSAFANVWAELSGFNIAQLATSFTNAQLMSVKMGMSFEDTVKFLEANKQTLALYGQSGFDGLRAQLGKTFLGFGYSLKQSAEMIGPAIENAAATGIDVRDPAKLNSFIDQTMSHFQKISGIIGISAKQYFELNAQLANNNDVTKTMIGMGREQAAAYLQGIEQQRDEMTVRGMSIEQAQKLIEEQEAARHASVNERVKAGAMIAFQMQRFGASQADSMRAMRTVQLGQNASKEDREWLTAQEQRLGVQQQQAIASGGQNVGATLIQGGLAEATMAGLGREATIEENYAGEKATRANQGMTEAQRAKVQEATKGSAEVGVVGSFIDMFNSAKNNSIVKAALSVPTALTSLTMSAWMASRALMGVGMSGGPMGTLFSKLAGKLGFGGGEKAAMDMGKLAASSGSVLTGAGEVGAGTAAGGGVMARLAKGAGSAGGLLKGGAKVAGGMISKLSGPLAGLAALYEGYEGWSNAADQEAAGEITHREAVNQKTGAVTGAVGGLGGAAAGAALGTMIFPVVGTALGAAIGGWLGSKGGDMVGEKAADVVQDMTPASRITGQPTGTDTGTTVNSTTASTSETQGTEPKIMNVADMTAQGLLTTISDNIAASVQLLQTIASANNTPALLPSSGGGMKISSNTYLQG